MFETVRALCWTLSVTIGLIWSSRSSRDMVVMQLRDYQGRAEEAWVSQTVMKEGEWGGRRLDPGRHGEVLWLIGWSSCWQFNAREGVGNVSFVWLFSEGGVCCFFSFAVAPERIIMKAN